MTDHTLFCQNGNNDFFESNEVSNEIKDQHKQTRANHFLFIITNDVDNVTIILKNELYQDIAKDVWYNFIFHFNTKKRSNYKKFNTKIEKEFRWNRKNIKIDILSKHANNNNDKKEIFHINIFSNNNNIEHYYALFEERLNKNIPYAYWNHVDRFSDMVN